MIKPRVFISFDFDNDEKLKTFLAAQAKNPDSPFSISDCSLKEATPERNREQKAERKIKQCDGVIVMVGPETCRAAGMLKEVKIARRNSIPAAQIIGYRNGNYRPVPNAGQLHKWDWENLKNITRRWA